MFCLRLQYAVRFRDDFSLVVIFLGIFFFLEKWNFPVGADMKFIADKCDSSINSFNRVIEHLKTLSVIKSVVRPSIFFPS